MDMRCSAFLEIAPANSNAVPHVTRRAGTSTTAPVFVDKSLFLHARDSRDPVKRRIAVDWLEFLWRERLARTSMHVLSEYYVSATRGLDPGFARDEAWNDIEALLAWGPQPTDAELMRRARDIERRHRLGWWDSVVVASAQLQGCNMLLTDELPPGAVYDGVVIHNPFMFGVAETAPPYAPTRAATVSDSLGLAT